MLLAYQKRLSADLFAQFLNASESVYSKSCPTRNLLLPFKRILLWGQRSA